MGGNRSHRIMERGGGGSTLGDRLWNVTWIKTLRNGILDELLFDLLLFVPISEVLLNFLNPAAPSLSLLIRIDGEREKWRPTCDLLPLNHCAASSSQ
ncbi:hypothetical protein ACMD2_06571 [Ananas comosus]|nr:hypothetical protein ACMD2_06571 [Ananas comosus]